MKIESDLFHTISRDERQEQCRKAWIKHKCKAVIEAATGFGKTRIGINCINTVLKRFPDYKILIIVPTDALKCQWIKLLDNQGLGLNCEVIVINTVIKNHYKCDFLILDECHRYASDTFINLFKVIDYTFILGLTATLERLDGREELIKQYCPIADKVSLSECLENGWVSPYKEYLVLLDVNDLSDYQALNNEFTEHFGFFGFNFSLAMSLIGKDGWRNKLLLRDEMCSDSSKKAEVLQAINFHSIRFMATMQGKKAFINNHPKKIEIATKIIEARKNKKIITFSNNIKMAEKIPHAIVYSGKTSKKRSATAIDDFNSGKITLLSTIKKADEGIDIKGLSVAIMLGIDSSTIKAKQRKGRVIRFEQGKVAEVFNLVLNHTQEVKWFQNSHKDDSYITINEKELDDILAGKQITPTTKILPKFDFRY